MKVAVQPASTKSGVYDISGQVSTIGLILKDAKASRSTEDILANVNVSAEMISSNGRDNKELFKNVPLAVISAFVNQGSQFIQTEKTGSTNETYVNIPLCWNGALALDKTRYVRFTIEKFVDDLDIDIHQIGSSALGAEPIRIINHNLREKETTTQKLTGVNALVWKRGLLKSLKLKSVFGEELDLVERELPFLENVMGDIFEVSKGMGSETVSLKEHFVLSTDGMVNVKLECGNLPLMLYACYRDHSNSLLEDCNC